MVCFHDIIDFSLMQVPDIRIMKSPPKQLSGGFPPVNYQVPYSRQFWKKGVKQGAPLKVLVSLSSNFLNAISGDAAWTRDRNDLFWYANALVLAAGSVCRPKQHQRKWTFLAVTGGYHPVTVVASSLGERRRAINWRISSSYVQWSPAGTSYQLQLARPISTWYIFYVQNYDNY